MRHKGIVVYGLCYLLFCGLAFAGTQVALGSPPPAGDERLAAYTATVSSEMVGVLRSQGYDVTAVRPTATGAEVDLVLWDYERAKIEGLGIPLVLKRSKSGQTNEDAATQQAVGGYTVWKSFDEPGGFKDRIYNTASANPGVVKLVEIGRSHQGRPLVALKVTDNARNERDGSRPAVLFQSATHAREWIAPEVNYRLLQRILERYKAGDAEIVNLLKTREVWFVPVINPDGYQYTFKDETTRLWRKNLRDNDGNGAITFNDGVDTNRNWPGEKWGYDNEGSEDNITSFTYRGPSAASEPEVKAIVDLTKRLKLRTMIDYHSYIPAILYPTGWQVQTPAYDQPIFQALAGSTGASAVEGYQSKIAAELYTTNGTADDFGYEQRNAIAFTVELGEGTEGSGFVFPDDENLVQAEFEKNVEFALDLVRSAGDVSKPVSHIGNTVKPFYSDTFAESYGSPQRVQVLAKKELGDLTLKYAINDGPPRSSAAFGYNGGERVNDYDGVVYRPWRGLVRNADPGDTVRVWFQAKDGQQSEPFTYTVKQDTNAEVLVVAAEDYTGISPVQTGGLKYAQPYVDALVANKQKVDVYDVDANGRKAPDALGVLSHYKLVVWETGDDIITRDAGQAPGTASKLANDLQLEIRSYLNDGGKLIYAGKHAGLQYAAGGYVFDNATNTPERGCDTSAGLQTCQILTDDFVQYYLGAYRYNDAAGLDEEGNIFPARGQNNPYNTLSWAFTAPLSPTTTNASSFISTDYFLPKAQFPQFGGPRVVANYARPGGPFDPHTGNQAVYSQIGDSAYKRLTRTIDLRGQTSGKLEFWTSYDTEVDYDYLFVEAHTVGQDDWTTLPDANGNTIQETGSSCTDGWSSGPNALHPWLARYQTQTLSGTDVLCTPSGTSGVWNAANGNSGGWQQWSIDLSAYAGKQVEVSIAYANDQGVQGLGVLLDDAVVSTGQSTSFESGLEGWAVTGAPQGSPTNTNDFSLLKQGQFPEGAIIATEDTFFFGFGLEDVASATERNRLIGRAVRTLVP